MINIKQVKKCDLLKLIEIGKDIFDYPSYIKDFENYFKEDTIKIWKISTPKIIGFVIFYHVIDEIEIIHIGITKSCQRKNYGSIIVDKIKNLNDIKKIFLEVSVENTQAINFYLKNGFKKIGIRKAYYKLNKKRIDALRLLFEF
jgi:ribosomal-protein-alanine N-acetyltransferase